MVRSAANIDQAWIGFDAEKHLQRPCSSTPVVVVNDADAAGIGELYYGAARGHEGLVILTTLGTGIGTALIHDGVLVPNSELGHLEIDGHDAETARPRSARARPRTSPGRSGPSPAAAATTATSRTLLWPDLFVVGGGVSKKADQFLPLLSLRTPIVPARLREPGRHHRRGPPRHPVGLTRTAGMPRCRRCGTPPAGAVSAP